MSQDRPPTGLRGIFRSLRFRNYRLFFSGQLVSLIGTWIQIVALSWVVYLKTNSPFWLGLVNFSSQIPSFLVAPLAGVWVDRLNRRNTLVITQTLFMLQGLVMASLVYWQWITVWEIVALSAFNGLVSAFDMPTRQAFLVEMVEGKENLGNAIALNSSMFNGARLVGPAVAGVLLAKVGPALCFLLDSMSYLAVIAALLAMIVQPRPRVTRQLRVLHELREGLHYVLGFEPILAILVLLGMTSLLGMSYSVLMPVFAKSVLGGNASTYGLLMSAAGVGALAGAMYLASRSTVLGLGRIVVIAASLFGLGLIAFSLSSWLWLSMLLLVVVGFGMLVQMASSNTLVQTMVDEDKRGRVMSLYMVAFLGTAPFGSLMAGSLAKVIGPRVTIAICGLGCLMSAAVFAQWLPRLRIKARPVYMRLGILPAVPQTIPPVPGLIPPAEDSQNNEGDSA